MVISIRLDDRELKLKLNNLAQGLTNSKPVMKDISEQLLNYYGDEVFQEQGTTGVDKWRQLSAVTSLSREKRQGYYKAAPETTNKILIWTGRLRRGFDSTVSATKTVIFNKVPYFKYHQTGGGRLPKRTMLAITQKVITVVDTTFAKYINKLLK